MTKTPNEFELIRQYFDWSHDVADVPISVGDDAALIQTNAPMLVCTDTLIAGVHFPTDAPIDAIGHKALAVNLSDIAAMGGTPRWFTLALTLPESDAAWLQYFSGGMKNLAQEHGVSLIGGDTTRGPLSITVTAMGTPNERVLTRGGAQIGDVICVSGVLGEAAQGLSCWQREARPSAGDALHWMERLHRPTPRIALGRYLSSVATSAIDVSDGLLADLGHVLNASGVGAVLHADQIPAVNTPNGLELALCGGDDYELLFTLPASMWLTHQTTLNAITPVTQIGVVTENPEVTLLDALGNAMPYAALGYRHF